MFGASGAVNAYRSVLSAAGSSMMRGASRCEEPRTPVVASVPAARTATVAAPNRAVLMWMDSWVRGTPPSTRDPRRAVIRLPAPRSQLHVAEQREHGLDDLRLVRERDLLQGLGVRHRQVRARNARDRRIQEVE